MRLCRLIAARTLYRPSSSTVGFLLIFLASWFRTIPLCAQQTSSPNPSAAAVPYVLHAYADIVQIPALILSDTFSQLPPISRDDINISLDAGPQFHPSHIRLQGEDPLDLAVLLDMSGPAFNLQSDFSHSVADFAARSLHPGDRLSVYVTDCMLLRTVLNGSGSDGASVERAVNKELTYPGLHGRNLATPGCTERNHLWNVLATIAVSMNDSHRRRVIFAISDGVDHKSHVKWDGLKHFAGSRGIAIFGLNPDFATTQFTLQLATEDHFNSLCQLTGGMVRDTTPDSIGLDLTYLSDLVRNRYILEFPRPDGGKNGQHTINVWLSSTSAFIRPAGVTYRLPDPSSLTDPTTVPSPPSPAVYGKRRALSAPQ